MTNSQLSPADAAKLLLARRAARRNLLPWCQHALAPLRRSPQEHHRLLIDRLERVGTGEIDRLMVMMPPGSAKSTYASVLFPAWFMAKGEQSLIMASHTATLAQDFGRRIISTVRDHEQTLEYGHKSGGGDLWYTNNGCRVLSAGVGGAVTGSRADLAIIDDPVKSREDAESPTFRQKAWDWYWSDLHSRLKPSARIVLIMTRWHEDDLAGRFLETAPGEWHIVKLAAQAGDDDPLGREPGEFLWSGDPGYDYGGLLKRTKETLEKSGSMRDWSALYQQDPRPAGGALFKTEKIGAADAALPGGRFVRTWDLAATEKLGTRDPDWTAGVLMQQTVAGAYVIHDVVRFRGGPDEVEAAIVATAQRDGKGATVRLPEDPGQASKSQMLYLTRKLAGFKVVVKRVDRANKATRAAPFASQCNVGNVSMLRAAWNRSFLDELSSFPSGTHDDQVDAASDAFSELATEIEAKPARAVHLSHMGR